MGCVRQAGVRRRSMGRMNTYLLAPMAVLALLLAACDDKPRPGGPVPKAATATVVAPAQG
ncbi:hypothetical protein NS331_22495 [Pseudacidovorax intermedius]|uniref:Uncharacterized protein n=1 Tax=Pseudacidovorax intermedius TaxID=433924 RepID=A0A147GMQ2_9BURK|nr:hypothetical protein NS331_22495 [Pseudacidovorax intermedius]